MAITNYGELIADAKRYAKRSGLTDLDRFVQLAEMRIMYGSGDENDQLFTEPVRLQSMVVEGDITIAAAATEATLPSGFLEFAESPYISGTRSTPLEVITGANRILRSPSLPTEQPTEYAIVGNKMKFNATADQAYTIPATYYALTALTEAADTNELLTARPDIYLHAILIEIGLFTMSQTAISQALTQYKGSVSGAERYENKRRYKGTLVMKSDGGTP